jgi:phosphoribosylaminoimidazolecarboxamide formyltransferase/IMP cyclohydrolase
MSSPTIKRAIISVSDKSGLTEFVQALSASGVEIYSTGGTRRHLENDGIEVKDISQYTEFPEMMDGRLKTLHPKVFGGILCRHDREDDMNGIAEHGIIDFPLVVVNLYPFEQTVAREGVTMPEAIEQIDIGGPSLVRAAAKNHAFTTIATAPCQYGAIVEEIQASGSTSMELRTKLAEYDRAIADYFAEQLNDEAFPATVTLSLRKKTELRYGENPHQTAAVYHQSGTTSASVVDAKQLNGKELSYNNLLDLDSALSIARSFSQPAASVMKHNNPCGAAVGSTLAEAAAKGLAGDPLSAFGSVIGFNRVVDEETAKILSEPGLFIEAIVAPAFDPAAVEILTTIPKWKKNVRLMEVGSLDDPRSNVQFRFLEGGVLLQAPDIQPDPPEEFKIVTETQPDDALLNDLRFAWDICRYVKSNAIVICKDGMLLGAGAGQMSRVDSVDISINKAGDRVSGSVLASDAFFPFPDSIHKAAAAGVAAIIEPGGSKKDDEVIAACNEHGLPMVFTGRRHFKH